VRYLRNFKFPFVVFLTGACVLIIEVVATRILSPYFGNTVFTVSSVLGVVLAALSVGYYFGGRLADKHPSEKYFYLIILCGGLSVALLYLLMLFVLPSIGYALPATTGPAISSVLLFFLPASLLGLLSPFAIKLHQQSLRGKGTGQASGEIFFWSTLGSIFGSFFAGFVLIPWLGTRQIVFTVALALILLGLIPLLKIGFLRKYVLGVTILAIAFMVSVSPLIEKQEYVLYNHDGLYEQITIHDGEYLGKPTRFFSQDISSSGAMFLHSNDHVFDYTKYYCLYKVFAPHTKEVLVIGGGAYTIPKAVLEDSPQVHVDVSEIEPGLLALAQKYFKLPPTNRLSNYTQDGRRLLHDTSKRYDFIFSDVYYTVHSIPTHFTTQEFFKLVRERLTDNGLFVANIIGDLSSQKPSFTMSEIKTFKSVFPNSYFFATKSPSSHEGQNIIFVGLANQATVDLNSSTITNHEEEIIRSLAKQNINLNKLNLDEHTLLTDNFAPIERLVTPLIERISAN